MILKATKVVVSDNSGAKVAETIHVPGRYATIGDVIVVSIKDAIPGKTAKKGEVHYGVVLRTKKGIIRPDGSKIGFDSNAIALIKENGQPLATRIFGLVTQELRKNHPRLLALTNEKIC